MHHSLAAALAEARMKCILRQTQLRGCEERLCASSLVATAVDLPSASIGLSSFSLFAALLLLVRAPQPLCSQQLAFMSLPRHLRQRLLRAPPS
eukprot:5228447-Pleurochrysis_carterae.AAC.1